MELDKLKMLDDEHKDLCGMTLLEWEVFKQVGMPFVNIELYHKTLVNVRAALKRLRELEAP